MIQHDHDFKIGTPSSLGARVRECYVTIYRYEHILICWNIIIISRNRTSKEYNHLEIKVGVLDASEHHELNVNALLEYFGILHTYCMYLLIWSRNTL